MTQRPGQALFNALIGVDPAFAEMIRGGPEDPFYHDDRIGLTLERWRRRLTSPTLQIYRVGAGDVVAAQNPADARAIAADQCEAEEPVEGPLPDGETVPVRDRRGGMLLFPVAQLLATGVERGVVTRLRPFGAAVPG